MTTDREAPRTRRQDWVPHYVRGSLMIAASFASIAVLLALAT